MTPPGQSSSQPLPSKELGLFKKIIKSYEHKKYRFGLKYAKTILSNPNFSEHGETLAMKGLILNCMGKQQEAQECVKRGLMADLKSYVCWHVYGLVQRSDKKYDEAIKAYKRALLLDKDNMQILRDLALLQIQMRDFEGYKESRYHLLRLRPTQRVSWIGYATAYHLLKDYDKALTILAEFLQNNKPTSYDFEHSELVLYQNMILCEAGLLEEALSKLEENATVIVDKVTYMERRGAILMDLGRMDEAEKVYRQLIDRNPENIGYYDKLEICLGLGEGAPVSERVSMYDSFAERYKRAAAPRRQPLYLLEGLELSRRLDDWIVKGLRKGVPSLFKNLVPLYDSPAKVAIIEQLLLEYVKKVENNGYRGGSFHGDEEEMESPTSALWLYLLIAQHFDRVGNITMALKYAECAFAHTPTLIETLMIKAKIYKHAGDYSEAARLMDEAQSLDTADRYINSKCAKYLLRAGQRERAEKICAKFTREGDRASTTLNEMQCMWYELECARCFLAEGRYGDALKKAHQMEQHFVGMIEDQYDFHTYCLRKVTLCSPLKLLQEFICEWLIALKISRVPVRLADGLTAAELKKLKKQQKKQQEREQEQKKNVGKKDEYTNPAMQFDADALVKTQKPLDEAAKFIQHLHMLGSKHVTAYNLGFEVYLRKQKPLLMLKCLKKAADLDSNDPYLHVCRIKFLKYEETATLSGVVGELVKELSSQLFTITDPAVLNENFKNDNVNSLRHRLAVAECNIILDPCTESTTKNWIMKSLEDEKLVGRTLKTVVSLYNGIQYGRFGLWSKEELDTFVRQARTLFPHAQIFGGGSSPVMTPVDNEQPLDLLMSLGAESSDYEDHDEPENGRTSPHADVGCEFYSIYEAKEVLGRGLASTVRKCVEKGTGQVYAVKVVDISTEKQTEQEARRLKQETISEIEILRQISDHPSIITIHDFYTTPSFLFAVFEMAPKGELFDQLNKTVTVSEKKARRLMRQLFDGVAYMHSRNIVHRDLKLENILCIDDERIVISDFGFATILKENETLRELCGTPGYLSPEILRCQMYEDAPGQLLMMRMIQEGKYEFRAEQWSTITQEAKDMISGLLCVAVAQRLTAKQCLLEPWMNPAIEVYPKENMRKLFRQSIIMVRFICRLQKYKYLKTFVDRESLRKRPFRDRDIRHEAESAMFSVYGHWVNRGFYYSRDMLFANKPRPKYQKVEA
nr:Tetratricopeptide TPR2 and Tetratricopeptide TPR-3 and Serine threonine protein kinase-related domain containing protein [Haemonchus contortus]